MNFVLLIGWFVEQTEESSGMIPRAVQQVFRVAEELKSKGWEYKMEGQFLEIVRNPFCFVIPSSFLTSCLCSNSLRVRSDS